MNAISTLDAHDFAAAYAVEHASHAFPWSEKTFYSNHGERYLNLKITTEAQLAGFCIVQLVADEATLFNIAVHPKYQRKGLAKQLLNALLDELTARNISTLWLEVRESNLAAIALYESLGFNQLSVRPNYYPAQGNQREDAIIMANMLNVD